MKTKQQVEEYISQEKVSIDEKMDQLIPIVESTKVAIAKIAAEIDTVMAREIKPLELRREHLECKLKQVEHKIESLERTQIFLSKMPWFHKICASEKYYEIYTEGGNKRKQCAFCEEKPCLRGTQPEYII